jgi:hypothetical protein
VAIVRRVRIFLLFLYEEKERYKRQKDKRQKIKTKDKGKVESVTPNPLSGDKSVSLDPLPKGAREGLDCGGASGWI